MPKQTDLVGRQAEVTRLGLFLSDDTDRALVVHGESGVGKTALIDHICACAAGDGWQVVRVLGVAAEEPFALGGLHQLVIRLGQFTAGLAERDRAVLAPVFGGEPDAEVSVLPLVVAVLNVLESASRTQPVLVVVDDMHWLDSVSAEVLGAVGRRLTSARQRILAGQRVPSPSVFSGDGWSELPLAPLSTVDAEQLLERSGVPLSEAAKTAILTAAAGNPLALRELPRFADRIEAGSQTMPLTERLVAVFGGRLEQMTPDVRAALLRAALDGGAGSALSANRARYVMHDVEPAIAAGLLVVDPLGEIVFRHPLVPAAVVHQASPHERRDAHRDLAGLYPDVLVRRASHLAAAATEPDQDVADALGEAAQLSLRRGGLPAAAEWLRRAAELSTEPARRTALLAEAVFVTTRAGRIDQAKDLLDGAEFDAAQFALAVLADAYRTFHADGDAASTHLRLLGVLAAADGLDDQTVNRVANLLLAVSHFAGDAEMWERTNAALAPLQGRVHPAVLMYRTGVQDITVTVSAIRSVLDGSVALLPQVPDRFVLLLAFAAYCVDAMTEFRVPLQQAFAQVSQHGASIDAIEGGRIVVLDAIAAGNWDRAQQAGAQCLEWAAGDPGSEMLRHQCLGDLGLLAAGRGDLGTARRYAGEVTAWAKPRGLHYPLDLAERIAVRVALAEADYETAYQAATRISPPGQFPRHNIQVGNDMLDVVEAAVQTGRLAEARAHVAEAVRLNLAEVSPRVEALVLAISAMTAPDSAAGDLYQSALTHPGIEDFPFERARIALAQGMWLRRRLQHNEARAALEQAAEGFDRLGARPWADRAQAELRAAGTRRGRSPGEGIALSPQERLIAEQAAAGQSTKEIAAQLSLSTRTVDGHLSNAFRKLGVKRRARLSGALQQLDQTPE